MEEEVEIFLEDCDDQLTLMEGALVSIQDSGVDEDSIGTIFRAMHTIKGSAGMFGYEDIVTFAHAGENLLDAAREGDVVVNEEMVDLFLQCKDYLEKLIHAQTHEEEMSASELSLGKQLVSALITSLSSENSQESGDLGAITEATNEGKELPRWHISIRFKKDFFTTGMSIHSIFNFLNQIGRVLINEPILYNIPPLETLNPLHPYIGFELLFETDLPYKEIEEVFEFIIDDVDLMIFECSDEEALDTLISSRHEEKLAETLQNAHFYEATLLSSLVNKDVIEEVVAKEVSAVEPKKSLPDVNKPEELEILENEKSSKTEIVKSSSSAPKTSSSLRVDATKIDLLINYMSEIVIANSKIITLSEELKNTELEEASNRMRELLEVVRDGIMDIRMVQVGDSFAKFRRIVNDTAKKIGKNVEFVISGGETELDKTMVERISDPLVHMLRNSIDHGVELPDDRARIGKRVQGRVDLRAYADSGTIVIEIEDDGKGLDKDRILAKAIENGTVSPTAQLSDAEIYKLIFAAGLSTAEKISDISGRGVGMDVVRRNIEDLRGTIDIDSSLGKGSKITIRLPLTLASIDGFLVQVGKTKYIIPLESIQECVELSLEDLEGMKGNEFINLRSEMLPIMDLRTLLDEEPNMGKRQNIVVVRFGAKVVGLVVDELLGEHQTVIKPLGDVFVNVNGISGGSILGSGEVALIFDIARLVEYKI